MEYTDEYVHVNTSSLTLNASTGAFEVVFNYDNNRPPYVLVEAISATVHAVNNTVDTFIIMAEEIATNVYNNDNKGTTLALVDYNTQVQAGHHNYDLLRQGSRALFSTSRTLNLYLTNEAGAVILPSTGILINVNILFKISRPVVGSIQPAYRSQIPL